jgi:hypothetical protein
MRRSICYTEPSHATAGELNTWKFIYTPATKLPKGTKLKFDVMSAGRDIDWELPTADPKATANVIYAKLENGKTIQAKKIEYPDRFTPDFEFQLPSEVESGQPLAIFIGSPKLQKNSLTKNGTRAQTFSQRRKTFGLHIDPTGKGNYEEEEMFSLDIRGAKLHLIRVLTPSFVVKNKRFDVVVRFEDEFGNLTSNAPEDTLVELTYENIRENLNWKLFVPETGFITLPNLYFNEAGIFTISLSNNQNKDIFKSPPIKCFPDTKKSLYWGLLHGESERVDSTENIESCLRHFRDERAFSFFASSGFESADETPNEIWKMVVQNVDEFNENERYSAFLGFQWHGEKKSEGIRQFLYSKDSKSLLRKKESKNSSLKKIYKHLSPKEAISIPCFTMGKGLDCDFSEFNPEFERVVEIYNAWGSSECTVKEGNLLPIKGPKGCIQETAEGSIQKALKKNLRFGFVAGGLDDRGVYAEFFDDGQEQYPPGLTGIVADEHSRNSLFESLYKRSCYGTTGERIILGLDLAGSSMGSELTTAEKPGLTVNRHLAGYVAGTSKLHSVEIIRNGEVLKAYDDIEGYSLEFTFDDMDSLSKVTIDNKDSKPPFVYYYLRVTQEDGHMGWSSPIWVDFEPAVPAAKPKPSKPAPKKKEIIEDLDDEE